MRGKRRKFKVLDEEEFYRIGRSRGVIKISEEENSNLRIISFAREIKKEDGSWVPKRKKFFSVSFRFIGRIVDILIRHARKFGWKVRALEKPEKQIKELKRELYEAIKRRDELERITKDLESEIENYRKSLASLRQKIVEDNVESFKQDIQEFETLLNEFDQGNKREEDIQRFLKEKCWIFSPEYNKVKPKRPAGSKSVFDFYLEDYKGQGTIVELKLPSDPIFTEDETYGLSPKVGKALGQLMRYIETTIAISHSERLRKVEEIYEIRPLGFLVIGRTKSQEEIDKLKIINSYLHFVQILSYDLLLLRAKSFIEWLD